MQVQASVSLGIVIQTLLIAVCSALAAWVYNMGKSVAVIQVTQESDRTKINEAMSKTTSDLIIKGVIDKIESVEERLGEQNKNLEYRLNRLETKLDRLTDMSERTSERNNDGKVRPERSS